jgi:hypothetical protein
MTQPETKRSFGLPERYAGEPRLSIQTELSKKAVPSIFLRLQSLIEPIVANGCTCSKSAAKAPLLVEAPPSTATGVGRAGVPDPTVPDCYKF